MMSDRSTTPELARYWRLLATIIVMVALSAGMMVFAAGGGLLDAVIIGGVGLFVGFGVAAYIWQLIRRSRRR